jgi:hypothetical protein
VAALLSNSSTFINEMEVETRGIQTSQVHTIDVEAESEELEPPKFHETIWSCSRGRSDRTVSQVGLILSNRQDSSRRSSHQNAGRQLLHVLIVSTLWKDATKSIVLKGTMPVGEGGKIANILLAVRDEPNFSHGPCISYIPPYPQILSEQERGTEK